MSKQLVLDDKAERAIIKNDIKTNLLVEAGAGSGKTSEMSNRIVSLVKDGYRQIGEIVAITFTKKAANELQDRVRKKIISEYEETHNPYLKTAMEKYHECFIGTIHSFCGKLLRERPIEARVDPSFEELDDVSDARILDGAFEEFCFLADDESKEILKQLYKLGVKDSLLKSVLKLVCDNQDINFNIAKEEFCEIDSAVSKVFDSCNVEVMKIINNMPDELNLGSDLDKLQKTVLTFKKRSEGKSEITFEDKVNLLKLFKAKNSIDIVQKKWNIEKNEIKEIHALMVEFRETEILPIIEKVNTYIYNNLLIPFAKKAKVIYQAYKDRNSKLNFQDLLLKTAYMLRDNSDVRVYFQERYKTILVDEFQDTDPIQSQLLMYLVGEDIYDKNWDKLIPKEGSLFVVGDPKQSIYAFRRADIEIYEKFKSIITKNGGKCIKLISNFRTVSELGKWYNYAFDKLLNVGNLYSYSEDFKEVKQAEFSGMSTINESLPQTLSGVYYYTTEVDKGATNDDVFKADEKNLECIIKWLVSSQKITCWKTVNSKDGYKIEYSSRGVEYKDIMILTMKKNYLARLSLELAKSGIPTKVTGANVMEKTSSFGVLTNIIKMLAYPEEMSYLYRIMVDFPFHFTRNELTTFINFGGRFDIYFEFDKFFCDNHLSDEVKMVFEKVNRCFEMLKRFTVYSKSIPCGALVEKILEETGLQRRLLSSVENNSEIGSFIGLIEKIKLNDVTDIWGVDRLADNMRDMLLSKFEEENDIQGTEYNAVRIMNVHKAKGLEAPIIILALPFGTKKKEQNLYVERITNEDDEMVYNAHVNLKVEPDKLNCNEYVTSSEWKRFETIAEYKASLESDRVLYVAATRPRNVLIIGESAKNNPWEGLIKLLPTGAKDILQGIGITQQFEDVEFSDELLELDILSEINAKRNAAFRDNFSTFSEVAPSGLKHSEAEFSEEFIPGVEELINKNTIKVAIELSEESETSDMMLGTIVHKVLETKIKSPDEIEKVISGILEKTQLKDMSKEFLNDVLKKFEESNLYRRVCAAKKVYTEVPFSIKNNSMYATGIMDLVFLEDDKWVIVDYKTCNSHQDKKKLYSEYMGQISMYKTAWEKISGSINTCVELYFVEKG